MKTNDRFQLGEWIVSPGEGLVQPADPQRDPETRRLQPKVMELLVFLVEHEGRVVSKEEILESVWPETFVEEGALAQAMHSLRKTLDENARAPRLIETIPRRGYRLIEPVRPALSAANSPPLLPGRGRHPRLRSWKGPTTLAAVLVVLSFGTLWMSRPLTTPSPTPQIRIAILPFVTQSVHDLKPEVAFWAAGLVERLREDLKTTEGLRVQGSRTSEELASVTRSQDLPQNLQVDYLVDGTIFWYPPQGQAARKAEVRVVLTNFEQDQEIWSDSYQVSAADIPRLSEGIHSQLRGALDLGEEEGEREGEGANRATLSDNDEATEYYVKALVLLKNPDFEMETINHAIDLLGTATRLDPHFTLAFAELTKAQALLSFNGKRYQGNLARTALQIAQGLAPDSREVLVAEAFTYFRVDHNYEAAIDTFFRASGVPPDQIAELRDGEILQGIGFCRRRQGDLEGATDALKVAFDLDPLDASLAGELAKTYMARRDHGKAETQFDLSLDVEPNQPQLAGDRAMNFLWGSPCPSEHRSCAVKDARLLLHRAEVEDEKKGYLVYFDFLLDLFAAADLQGEARLAAFQKALDRLDEVPPAALNSQDRYSLFWRRAFLQRRLGKSEIAEAQAAWYAPLLDDEIRNTPDYAYPYAYRAMAHALLGERQEALVIASQAVQIADDKDQYSSPRQNQSCLSGRLAAQTRPLLLPGW